MLHQTSDWSIRLVVSSKQSERVTAGGNVLGLNYSPCERNIGDNEKLLIQKFWGMLLSTTDYSSKPKSVERFRRWNPRNR